MYKLFIVSIILLIGSAGTVLGQHFDCEYCIATMPGVDGEDVVLFVLPDGTGSSFYNAQVRDTGQNIDAHIEFILMDQFGAPVADFPREDMWLESGDGGMIPCIGGNTADANTDENGFTAWENPLHAGGHSEDFLYVMVNGGSLPAPPFSMAFVSADMNGDGAVNLTDVGFFSSLFFGDYSYQADFFADGVLNLADVGRLAQGLGGSCP